MFLNFGRYKGKSVEFVLSVDPKYVRWANQKGLVSVDKEAINNAVATVAEEMFYYGLDMEMRHSNFGDRD